MNKVVLIILAILLPPVAVFWKSGFGKDLIINVVLCLILFFPGMIHAIWVSTK
ncbi:YqaE/Pmp3 family membrane protein [Psychromonas sp. KJ10-10]|uniref:YqaE/Pmp3 family membrane protein n=1 Tax=Psychromonas sp. KJ10-10 TaxID=3391823 RepID=UPI0039B64542